MIKKIRGVVNICGISVLITKSLNNQNLKTFNKLLEDQKERGGDSVGVYLCSKDYEEVFYVLDKNPKGVLKRVNQYIYDKNLFTQPLILLGHTRATATGSNKDYHPSVSDNKKIVMIHNGVCYDEYGFYYHNNDTYHLSNVLDYEIKNKKDKRELKERITTSGSTIFYINRELKTLNFLKIGYTPLLEYKTNNTIFYCSINKTLNKNLFTPKKGGFYRLNINKLLKNREFVINKDIKWITDDYLSYNKKIYNITNRGYLPKTEDDIWENNYKGGSCGLYGGSCYACYDCIDLEDNEVRVYIEDKNQKSLKKFFD